MEREIEVKLLGLDNEKFLEVLREKGEFLLEEVQHNFLINSKTHPIDEGLGYLRLREIKTNSTTYILTFKERVKDKDARISLEHSTEIKDKNELFKILNLLGYNEIKKNTKRRISYTYKTCRFDFDTYIDLSIEPYFEVEAPSKEVLESVLDEFDIKKENISTKSIKDLLK